MGWIESELFGFDCPSFADVFIRCEAFECLEPLAEIMGVDEVRCRSACKKGSDSNLMQFYCGMALVSLAINAMKNALKPSNLVPAGFEVVGADSDSAATVVTVRATNRACACPSCGSLSE